MLATFYVEMRTAMSPKLIYLIRIIGVNYYFSKLLLNIIDNLPNVTSMSRYSFLAENNYFLFHIVYIIVD